jgi:uncharacterized protein with PIN domain
MAEPTPRFLADAMLGKLARWLRVLGYDTAYVQGDDAYVAQRARAEDRVLLTRDHELTRRKGLCTLLITSQKLEVQMAQVIDTFGLPEKGTPRCMVCNAPLDIISVEEARAHVPIYVAETQTTFQRCAKCGKIYWQGTHWQGIEGCLRQAQQIAGDE